MTCSSFKSWPCRQAKLDFEKHERLKLQEILEKELNLEEASKDVAHKQQDLAVQVSKFEVFIFYTENHLHAKAKL